MKHHLDLFVENEIKLIRDIQNYLDELCQGEFQKFGVYKIDKDNYNFSFNIPDYIKLEAVKIQSIACLLNVIEIYEKAAAIKWSSLEELMEIYIREQLVEEIKVIINGPQEGDIIEEI